MYAYLIILVSRRVFFFFGAHGFHPVILSIIFDIHVFLLAEPGTTYTLILYVKWCYNESGDYK